MPERRSEAARIYPQQSVTETPISDSGRWPFRREHIRTLERRLFPFASGAFAAVMILLLHGLTTPPPVQLTTRDVQNAIVQAMASATPPPALSAQIYPAILPSVVLVETHRRLGSGSPIRFSPATQPGGGLHFVQDEEGVATGVIVNADGDILTSLHVVASATELWATFADGTYSQAELVGSLPDSDIAVLRAQQPPEQIVPATLGNPNALRIGDEAYVVGHPFGLQDSMSAGVISGLHRTFKPPNSPTEMHDLIQFDAATNPGASGGPLLNRYGQVVGIVSMLLNPTDQNVFIGIGFAVTITTAGGAAGLPPR